MFRGLLEKNRCIVPANGFYEWKNTDTGKKPYFVHLRNKALFGFAGLWNRHLGPEGREVYTYTLITTEPNEVLAPIHTRMPVILRKPAEQAWLATSEKTDDVHAMLAPYPAEEMTAYQVSSQVNSVISDGEDLTRPMPAQKSWLIREP
jgi:putative SOS response-associated peptidase YedK